jgi:hypothetical protein
MKDGEAIAKVQNRRKKAKKRKKTSVLEVLMSLAPFAHLCGDFCNCF